MEREDLELLSAEALELDRRARVERGPAAERQPRVRGVADQRVPEAETAGNIRVPLDELGEPVPGVRIARRGPVLDDGGHELAVKRLAEHRRPAEKRAVGGAQPVDPARRRRPRPSPAARPPPCPSPRFAQRRAPAGTAGCRPRARRSRRPPARRRRPPPPARAPSRRRRSAARPASSPREWAGCRRRRRSRPERVAAWRRSNQGWFVSCAARWRRSSDEASSIQWTSSRRSAAGPGRSRWSSVSTAP